MPPADVSACSPSSTLPLPASKNPGKAQGYLLPTSGPPFICKETWKQKKGEGRGRCRFSSALLMCNWGGSISPLPVRHKSCRAAIAKSNTVDPAASHAGQGESGRRLLLVEKAGKDRKSI